MASKRDKLRSINKRVEESKSGGDIVDEIIAGVNDVPDDNNKLTEASPVDIPVLSPLAPQGINSGVFAEIPPVSPKVHRTVYLTTDQANQLKVEEVSKKKEPTMTKLMDIGISTMLAMSPESYNKLKAVSMMRGKDFPALMAEILMDYVSSMG